MARTIFILAILTPSVSYAADPNPEPVRKWVIATYKTLAEVARDNPLTASEKMWEKVDECVPDGPIELRAKVKSLSWKDGVLKVRFDEPLGWYTRKGLTPPKIHYTDEYHILVTEEEATKLRPGTFVIIKAPLKLFTDYGEFLRNHSKTHWIVLTVFIDSGKSAKLASDAIEFQLDGKTYSVVYDK